eukprot:3941203-Rhodomonas_salina.2
MLVCDLGVLMSTSDIVLLSKECYSALIRVLPEPPSDAVLLMSDIDGTLVGDEGATQRFRSVNSLALRGGINDVSPQRWYKLYCAGGLTCLISQRQGREESAVLAQAYGIPDWSLRAAESGTDGGVWDSGHAA